MFEQYSQQHALSLFLLAVFMRLDLMAANFENDIWTPVSLRNSMYAMATLFSMYLSGSWVFTLLAAADGSAAETSPVM